MYYYIQNKIYQYNKNLIENVYDFATKKEQQQLDARQKTADAKNKQIQTNLSLQNEWEKTAFQNQNTDLIQSISLLDTASPDFQQKLGDIISQIKIKAKEVEKWGEPYNLGGDLVQKNLSTGEIRTAVNMPIGGRMKISGDFTPEYINTRAAQYISEDGSIDWTAVDELQDVDANLWRQVSNNLNNAIQEAQQAATIQPAPELSPIEKEIAGLKESEILTNRDIANVLKQQGYPEQEVNISSVGGIVGKAKNILDTAGSFFSNLFGF